MKKSLYTQPLIFSMFIITSCSFESNREARTESFFIKEQKQYEEVLDKKLENDKANKAYMDSFFEENKEELSKRVKYIRSVVKTLDEKESNAHKYDSMYYWMEGQITNARDLIDPSSPFVNSFSSFGSISVSGYTSSVSKLHKPKRSKKFKGLIVHSEESQDMEEAIPSFYQKLSKVKTIDDLSTLLYSENDIRYFKEVLESKVLFVLTSNVIMNPSIDFTQDEFNTGIYYGNLDAYDLESEKYLTNIRIISSSNEEVRYKENQTESAVTKALINSFHSNIKSDLRKSIDAHFGE